jgi:ferredoxin
LPVSKEHKKTIQIGVSKFIKNICVVVDKHTQCGACSEHCPTKAVEMVPYLDNLKIPRVDEKICVGCGACEYACPTKPEKAIYVESNLFHHIAMKPLKKVEGKLKLNKPEEDFPF